NLNQLNNKLNQEISQCPQIVSGPADLHFSNDLIRLFNRCDKLSQERKDQYISSELFLLAALEDQGTLGTLLKNFHLDAKAVAKGIEKARGGQNVQDQN